VRSPSTVPALAVLASLTVGASALAVTLEVRDFLIQDVCVDEQDRPIAGAPYSCTSRLDLRPGELLRVWI
jgi:hypothetical protein